MRRAGPIALLAAGGTALGIVAEARSGASLPRAAADLATGWALLACGLWGLWGLWTRRRSPQWAPLLMAAATGWFAGTLDDGLVYVHRGPLVHAVIAATGDRSALAVATIVVGYADALVVDSANGWLSVATIVLLALVAGGRVVRGRPTEPRVVAALVAVATALALGASTVLVEVSSAYAGAALYVYEATVALAALLLVAAALHERRARGALADLVIELGPARRSPGTRQALAGALGDPTLTVAYWRPGAACWVDLDGAAVALPAAGSRRATTIVEHEGERIAALVHDVDLLDEAALVDAVREAAGLMLANGRLQAEASARLTELRASRQRLVAARDAQRRRLATRLHDGAQLRLAQVAAAVQHARPDTDPTAEQSELLDLIERELGQARIEVDELARGIHPRVLIEGGLAPALAMLAERAALPVALSAPAGRLPDPVEAAVYFVCSEALANVAKYARATRVRCEVIRDGDRVRVVVEDDGAGGADPRLGSGLRGLADRVEALGGRLEVTSPPGVGTTIRAELSLDPDMP